MRTKQIVVIGSSIDNEHNDQAYEIGKYIASNGWILISGGRSGIMESVSKGAREENGIVIGILPDSSLETANPYCNIVIPTGMGYARNMINVLSGDVVIAIGGRAGTLSELAYAEIYNKPVILCAFAEGWSNKLSTQPMYAEGGKMYIANHLDDVYRFLGEILAQ